MQAANLVISGTLPATENATPVLPLAPLLLASGSELPTLPPELVPLVGVCDVVVVPKLATAGVCEPPQPAVATPMAARVTARTHLLTETHETSCF
jgi:hypothetical protein